MHRKHLHCLLIELLSDEMLGDLMSGDGRFSLTHDLGERFESFEIQLV
jgi:hypothetical protein